MLWQLVIPVGNKLCFYVFQNTYKVPGISAEIDAEVFVPAHYNATATMTSNGEFVGCYTATFEIED